MKKDVLTQNCAGGIIERNEMNRKCSAYGEEEKRIQGYGGETLDHLGDPGIDGRIILR
jgi:hypothetical protein